MVIDSRFEFRHLRCFLMLADELHFGRAAQRLAMTQPPLSVNIRQLEDAVGTRLFERDSRGVRLTAAGQAFRGHATAMLARADEACVTAREVAAGAVGRLRIGLVGTLLYRGLPQWMQAFAKTHPGIELALVELNSQQQLDALSRGELDLAFVHGRRAPPSLQARPVFAEPVMACVPADHAVARRRKLHLAELRDEPFILFSRSVSPDYHAQIIELCAEAGFYPRVRHELRHWLSVVALVSQGMGVAVVPAPLQRSGLAGAAFRPLADCDATSQLRCVWSPERDLPALQAFRRTVLGDSADGAGATHSVRT
ncbi:MAG: LysR family transcriptional regulator [Rubrivivax sp.]|nr:LysR family transcriptional regulator [Rubrivivax sp.]